MEGISKGHETIKLVVLQQHTTLEMVLTELLVVHCAYLRLTASSIFIWELKWNLGVDMVLIRKETGCNMLGDKKSFLVGICFCILSKLLKMHFTAKDIFMQYC